MGIWLAMLVAAPQVVASAENGSVRVRALRVGPEVVEELAAKDARGEYQTILVSPTHPNIARISGAAQANLLSGGQSRLFDAPPTFHFTTALATKGSIRLGSKIGDWSITKQIILPEKGSLIKVYVHANTPSPYPQLRYLLTTYAFAPGKPDETWAPGLRPGDSDVIGDHFFRAPAATLRKGSLAATVMPDLDVLEQIRPIPTILDLDVKNGVVNAPLVSYGFADHRLTAHVRFSQDASMIRPVPWDLGIGMQIKLDAKAAPGSSLADASRYMWERYGHGNFQKILPQILPFADYARLCYPAAFNEKMTGGWFERTINGQVCGGIPSGWGLESGWVSWQCWFNQLRSAWGLRWWGKRLNDRDWVDKADKMLNLALAAPMNKGACPTTYLSRTNEWKGSLIVPSPECYYDVPSIAWKGIWLRRWLQFEDCPRRDEIERQLKSMRGLMLQVQNPDGSYPSWLTKDFKPAAPLDHSAQSGLAGWFLASEAQHLVSLMQNRQGDAKEQTDEFSKLELSVRKANRFLLDNVVDRRLYYDFETFFSCSPKQCLQMNGTIDDPKMWDAHTQQPPQNTLCMQWAAESLRCGASIHRVRLSEVGSSQDRDLERQKSLSALDTMSMYQNVWPISYRKAANTFGGFGVQNSDGEYNDARQAQFGATLCDFGAQLHRQDLFERGVAAVRASLTLVNVPDDPRDYPNPNYPPGLEPENTGHGGRDEQDGRTGFDWGEGSGLAAAAELIDKYGEGYVDKMAGWGVGIDGIIFSSDLKRTGTNLDFYADRTKPGDRPECTVRYSDGTTRGVPVNAMPRPTESPNTAIGETAPGKMGLSVHLWPVGSDSGAAELLPNGPRRLKGRIETFGASDGTGFAQFEASQVDLKNPMTLRANLNGWQLELTNLWFLYDPTFNFTDPRMPGWEAEGDFLRWPTRSTRMNFNSGGLPFIGTCEDGHGGFEDNYTGTVTSPWFTSSGKPIHLMVGGGSGDGVGVELLDQEGKRIQVARGSDEERMHEVVWKTKADTYRIRIFDHEKAGWGHINVGKIWAG